MVQFWLMLVVLIPGGWEEHLLAATANPALCEKQAAHMRQFPDGILQPNETVYCKEVIVL